VDAADKSMVDTTCKELREGKDLYEMTIGVEINEVREIAVKNGKNRGRKMAYLCVSDETGALDDVTVFSEAWAEYGHLLAREKTVAALQGRKDQQRGSFIVDKVWEI
jgi:DNA polymerase III alpha subunit